jgi:hypothetical protein
MQKAISAFSTHLFDQQHISFVKCVKNWHFDPVSKKPVPHLLPIANGGLPIEHDQIGFLLLDALTLDRKPEYFFTATQFGELTHSADTGLIHKLSLPYKLDPDTHDDTSTTPQTYFITSKSGTSDVIYVTLHDVVNNAVGAVTRMNTRKRNNLI